MAKRKRINIRDSDSHNELQKIKHCIKSKEDKLGSLDNNTKIKVDASVNNHGSTNVVTGRGTNKRKYVNTKYVGRLTRSRSCKIDKEVERVESDTPISNGNSNAIHVISVIVDKDNKDANDHIPKQQKIDAVYLSVKDGNNQTGTQQTTTQTQTKANLSLKKTADVDKDLQLNQKTTQCIEKTMMPSDDVLSSEIIEIDSGSEIIQQTAQCTPKTIVQTDGEKTMKPSDDVLSSEIIEIDSGSEIIQQTAQCTPKTIVQTDGEKTMKPSDDVLSSEIIEIDSGSEIIQQTAQCTPKTIVQTDGEKTMKPSDDVLSSEIIEIDSGSETIQQTAQCTPKTIVQTDGEKTMKPSDDVLSSEIIEIDSGSETIQQTAQCTPKTIVQTDGDPFLETIEEVDRDSEINEQTNKNIEKIIEQMDTDPSLETFKEVDRDSEINEQTNKNIEKIIEQMDTDPSLETFKEVDRDSEINEQTNKNIEKIIEQMDTDPSLETFKEVEKNSERNRKTIQCTAKTIEQMDGDSFFETIEEVGGDGEMNEQTIRSIEKIIEHMDADPSRVTMEEVNKNSEMNQETVQCTEKTTEQINAIPSLKTTEEIVPTFTGLLLLLPIQSVHNISHQDFLRDQQTIKTTEKIIEQMDTNPSLETIKVINKDSGINQQTTQCTEKTTEQIEAIEEPNQQTIQHFSTSNTIKKIEVCVSTEELDELLKKKQIYPWTQLHQTQESKENVNADDEEENKNGKINKCIQTVPVAKEWQHVINAMEDPGGVVSFTDKLLIIKERQPKGRFHYLILPIENMRSLNELNREYMPLLENMEEAAKKLISNAEHSGETFRFGFIAKPTMIVLKNQKFLWLHMHVISNTPNFGYITKKQIWNTFHSKMFITMQEVKHFIETTGTVPMPTPEDCNFFLSDDVVCHQCNFSSSKLPHLIQHINDIHLHKGKRKKKRGKYVNM